jgi:hypothetical protein
VGAVKGDPGASEADRGGADNCGESNGIHSAAVFQPVSGRDGRPGRGTPAEEHGRSPVTVRGVGPVHLVPELTFAAIGALAGVLIQQVIQAWTSYLGRRSDRVLKTYETKLDVFTEFLLTIDELSELVKYINKVESDPEFQEFLAARAKITRTVAIIDDLAGALKPDPLPTPEVAAALRESARHAAQQIADACAIIVKAAPRMNRLHEEVKTKQELIETHRTNFRRLGFKLRLMVDDDRLDEILLRMMQRVWSREPVDSRDYTAFLRIAAKYVGIR